MRVSKAETPAPGESTPSDLFSTLATTGGVISRGKPKSDVEWKMYFAAQIPAPGKHQPDHSRSSMPTPGGRFNHGCPKSHIEWLQYKARQEPGPADYAVSAGLFRCASHNALHSRTHKK